ncbi:MAG: hypothetical protein JKY15_02050 [Deltaproteobacteria bacterium]|nr:hypothetical protein [Deltaproteobacteria bacterium]
MNTPEKLAYLFGFMDCWEEFSIHYLKVDFQKIQAKKAYAIEKMLPYLAEKWTEEQVLQFYEDIKQNNIKGEISSQLKAKYDLDKIMASFKKSDLGNLM